MHQAALRIGLGLGALVGLVSVAVAQPAAQKILRIVVPFSAGASNDAIARVIAVPLGKRLDSTVIVDNRPGAAGIIGADAVAKSPRDGSTVLLTSSSFLTAAATQPKLPYDPIGAFAPVAVVGQNPSILAVTASAPFKTPAALFATARARPGELMYGSAGVGSLGHLVTEVMNVSAKVSMRHVPYKGAANAAIDLASGQIQVMMSSYNTLAPFVKSGKVRLIAVTSKAPYPAFPDLPPLIDTVPGFSSETWVGVLAPAGTPASVVARLNQEINDIAATPELKTFLESDGMMAVAMTPAAFSARIRQELAQWRQIATDRKIVME